MQDLSCPPYFYCGPPASCVFHNGLVPLECLLRDNLRFFHALAPGFYFWLGYFHTAAPDTT